jgi:hypothetical protein
MNRRDFLTASAVATATVAAKRSAAAPAAEAPLLQGIWDCHTHVGTPGPTPEKRMEALVRIADRMGVERMCINMSPPWSHEATPEQFRKSNDDVLAILKEWGSRAFGFVYLNPVHTRESLAELERCVADGPMIGIKLWVGTRANAASLDPIVKRARELDALILQHTWIKQRGKGNLPHESTPMELAELSARHAGFPIICGHTGGGDWALGIRAIRARAGAARGPRRRRSRRGRGRDGGTRTRRQPRALRQRRQRAQLRFADRTGDRRGHQRCRQATDPTRDLRRLLAPALRRKGIRA